ncbi:type III secretion protein [Lacticaseibacillus rhamnosus]
MSGDSESRSLAGKLRAHQRQDRYFVVTAAAGGSCERDLTSQVKTLATQPLLSPVPEDLGSAESPVTRAVGGDPQLAVAGEVAAPVLLALILTDVAFGVVSRVVPQLNVFAVGFPMKIIVGLLVVGVSLAFVGGWFYDQLQRSVESGLAGIGMG